MNSKSKFDNCCENNKKWKRRKRFLLGIWFTPKKLGVLEEIGVLQNLRNHKNIQLIQIDPSNIETFASSTGPLDGIFHKAIEQANLGKLGIEKYIDELERFENWHGQNPNIHLIDSTDSLEILTNRLSINKLLENLFNDDHLLFIPNSTLLTTELVKDSRVKFPLICKPEIPDGWPGSHDMMIVFNKTGLWKCPKPSVAQSFVNHDGVLYKAYSIKNRYFVTIRPSLQNIHVDDDINFDSGSSDDVLPFNRREIPKPPNWNSICIELTAKNNPNFHDLSYETLQTIFTRIQNQIKINLLGIDLILDSETKKFGLIDLNIFPSFRGIPNIAQIVTEYVYQELLQNA